MPKGDIKKPLYPIVVRYNSRYEFHELFMYDGDQLNCFSFYEGHGKASIGYMYERTKPTNRERALDIFNKYIEGWEGESIPVLRRNLRRIKS